MGELAHRFEGRGWQRDLCGFRQQPIKLGGHATKAWKRRGWSCQTQGRGWAIPERRRGGKGREERGEGGRGRGEARTLQDMHEL